MSNGATARLGPEASIGPRFSIIDMGEMVGPERMDTRGMLKHEMRSLYENHSMVRTLNRAMADPSDAVIALLKPLMVLVAVVVGFVGAALLMESRAAANKDATTEASVIQPADPIPEPEPVIAVADESAFEENAEESTKAEAMEAEATEAEEEITPAQSDAVAAATPSEQPRKVRKMKRGKKRRHHKRRRRGKRRRR